MGRTAIAPPGAIRPTPGEQERVMADPPPRPEDPGWSPEIGPTKRGLDSSATPPWLWLLVIGLLALIFWQFVPKTEVQVQYSPWFIEQVDNDNIKTISFQGTDFRGELREPKPFSTGTGAPTPVRRFYTYAPSEDLIKPVVDKLQDHAREDRKKGIEPVKIEGSPPNTATGLAWVMLLLPTFIIVAFIWLMMRRDRGG
jgi:cell division protease FtsH